MDASFKNFNLFICAVSGGDSKKGVYYEQSSVGKRLCSKIF